jgi:hypothetical protein
MKKALNSQHFKMVKETLRKQLEVDNLDLQK